MRIIFTISIFLFSFLHSNAQQEFAPIGAKWWYTPYCQDGLGRYCSLYTYEVIGDTLVEGISAKVIEYAEDRIVNPEGTLIMYGNGNQVYHLIDTTFYLLYDFEAQAGDTIISKIDNRPSYSAHGTPNGSFLFRYAIDSVSTIEIDNEILRVQYAKAIPESWNGLYGGWGIGHFEKNRIIEKIGYLGCGGIFGHENVFPAAGICGNLKCYQDNDVFYKDANRPCDSIGIQMVSNKNVFQEIDFKISPNPASDFINITYDLPDEFNAVTIQIIDLNGRIIEQRKLENNIGIVDWNITHLSNGLHFYHLKNKEKIIYTGKLLIMK